MKAFMPGEGLAMEWSLKMTCYWSPPTTKKESENQIFFFEPTIKNKILWIYVLIEQCTEKQIV